jgi:hypothetical protein
MVMELVDTMATISIENNNNEFGFIMSAKDFFISIHNAVMELIFLRSFVWLAVSIKPESSTDSKAALRKQP